MKKIIIAVLVLLGGLNIHSQENDTTKIKIGDTKIIIIDKKNDDSKSKKEKLEQGKEEFKKMLEEREKELAKQKLLQEENQMKIEEQEKIAESEVDESQKDQAIQKKLEYELLKKENEDRINELEKEVSALEKGIAGIDKELDQDDDWAKDKEWSKKDKFDWDFDDDWPRNWDNLSPFGRNKKFRGHWAGLEFGLNNYVDKNNAFVLEGDEANFELDAGRSWMYTINFAEYNIPFGKGVGLVTGFGTTVNNYHFRNNVNVTKSADNVIIAEQELEKSYYKNKISTWSFTMPLIFEFQMHRPGVYLGAGVVGSIKVLSWGKQCYWENGSKRKEKIRSDYLMNTFRYGLTLRAGFSFLKVFANYDLVTLFQKDRGPELYPVSVGITLISF